MKVDCCDFCMKILKEKDIYKYVVNYKEYELCENCYDDLVKIDNEKIEAITRANDIFNSKLKKLEERYKICVK